MSDLADWLDEPYPLDHTITWREHYAMKKEAEMWEEVYGMNGAQHD